MNQTKILEARKNIWESPESNHYIRKCVDGSAVGCSKCVGYCHYAEHPGFLTEKLRKQHRCLEKQCFHYEKKEPKIRSEINVYESQKKMLIKISEEKIKDYEGMVVLDIKHTNPKEWTLSYITISNEYPIKNIEKSIENATGYKIILERLNYDFENCIKIISKH